MADGRTARRSRGNRRQLNGEEKPFEEGITLMRACAAIKRENPWRDFGGVLHGFSRPDATRPASGAGDRYAHGRYYYINTLRVVVKQNAGRRIPYWGLRFFSPARSMGLAGRTEACASGSGGRSCAPSPAPRRPRPSPSFGRPPRSALRLGSPRWPGVLPGAQKRSERWKLLGSVGAGPCGGGHRGLGSRHPGYSAGGFSGLSGVRPRGGEAL